MKAVILCGGSGTRLWPISRTSHPKQFVPLFGNKSLFQLTVERNKNLVDGFVIVVNEKQLSLCQEQIPKDLISKTQFIIEPCGRNTAPAIALAAHLNPDDDLFVLPSDHLIKDQTAYNNTTGTALGFSNSGNLVTFGITPQYPEVGYGYIEADKNTVLSFKEKPNLETAKEYLKSGNYYWNSGMFLFKAKTYLAELESHHPDISEKSKKALTNANVENNIFRINLDDMQSIPADSIDYAVMEKSSRVKTVPSDFGWSDLGSFDSLFGEFTKDKNENASQSEAIQVNSHRNLIISDKLVTTFDVDDLIIVDTKDALLVGRRGESQNVKKVFEEVKKLKKELLD